MIDIPNTSDSELNIGMTEGNSNFNPLSNTQLTYPLDPVSIQIIEELISRNVPSIVQDVTVNGSSSGGGGSVVSSITAGTGIAVSASTGPVTISTNLTNGTGIGISGATISNTGVTSIVAGTNITISGSTGAVTINAAGGGASRTSGNNSWIMNNTPATQTIAHGLGVTPTFVRINAFVGGGVYTINCYGTYDGVTANYAYNANYPTVNQIGAGGTGFIMFLKFDSADRTQASITVDATNIYLAWTIVGSPNSGGIFFVWECEA